MSSQEKIQKLKIPEPFFKKKLMNIVKFLRTPFLQNTS